VIARTPDRFRAWCAHPLVAWLGEPVAVVQAFFCAFKALQLGVFAGWWWLHDGGWPSPGPLAPGIGAAAMIVGQTLNAAVFYRLGRVGVFYGDRLGYTVPRTTAFPFSLLRHPQYVGAVLTIWGFFVIMRFPAGDWYLVPAVETVYYAVGAALEERRPRAAIERPGAAPHRPEP
jgi:methylene-fatty-acyl-phospholipid synthase